MQFTCSLRIELPWQCAYYENYIKAASMELPSNFCAEITAYQKDNNIDLENIKKGFEFAPFSYGHLLHSRSFPILCTSSRSVTGTCIWSADLIPKCSYCNKHCQCIWCNLWKCPNSSFLKLFELCRKFTVPTALTVPLSLLYGTPISEGSGVSMIVSHVLSGHEANEIFLTVLQTVSNRDVTDIIFSFLPLTIFRYSASAWIESK